MRDSYRDIQEAKERRARKDAANAEMAEPNFETAEPFVEVAEPIMAEPTVAEPTAADLILEAADPPLVRSTASSSSVRGIVCTMPAVLGPFAKALVGRKGKNVVKRRAKKAPSVDPPTDDSDHRTFMFDAKKSLYKDGPGSTNLFSMIKHPDVSFPPPDVLVNSDDYAHMAQFGMKFFSSANKIVSAYDAEVIHNRRRAEDANAEARSWKHKLEESETLSVAKIRDLEEAKACLESDRARIAESAVQQAEELAALRSELEGERAKCEKKMKRAFKEGRQVAEKYRVRLEKAKASLVNLGKAKMDALYLAQAEANIQLVELLQGSEPPKLDQEKKKLYSWKLEVQGADYRYDKAEAGLFKDLAFSPISPCSESRYLEG